MDADNLELDGRNLAVRYSNDKTMEVKGGKKNNNNSGNNNKSSSGFSIFVGNMSFKSNEKSLKKFFEDCGEVTDVRIAKNQDGKLKGFCHIDFATKEGMDNAIKKNGEELDGRKLRIDASNSKGSGGGFSGKKGNFGRNKGNSNNDPMEKAKKSGAIIAPAENKVITFESSSEDE